MIEVGTILHESYRILRLLGEGGMGAVFEAAHVRLPKHFAIKVLHPEVLRNQAAFDRFRREAEISSSMGHPNIIEVHDFNHTADGQPYIVMEMLEGEDVAAMLKREGALGLARTIQLARPVASALQAAHAAGIIHRDLKPQNIFLHRKSGQEVVKILDFGISKITGTTDMQTKTSAVLGTPGYMSPEQARGRNSELTGRSDQFSLATMVYEMIGGKHPFVIEGADPVAVLYRIVAERAPLLEGVPAPVDEVLRKAMAKEPGERFADVAEFSHALDAAAEGRSLPSLSLRSGGGRRGGLLVAAAIAVVAIGGAGTWLALHRRTAPARPTVAASEATPTPKEVPAMPPPSPTVGIRLAIEPAGARATLDGKPIEGGAFTLSRGAPAGHLHVEADGHASSDTVVGTDRDQTLNIHLAPIAVATTPTHAAAKVAHGDHGGKKHDDKKKPVDDLEDPFAK